MPNSEGVDVTHNLDDCLFLEEAKSFDDAMQEAGMARQSTSEGILSRLSQFVAERIALNFPLGGPGSRSGVERAWFQE